MPLDNLCSGNARPLKNSDRDAAAEGDASSGDHAEVEVNDGDNGAELATPAGGVICSELLLLWLLLLLFIDIYPLHRAFRKHSKV